MSRGRLVPRTSRRMRVRATGSHDFVAAPQRAARRGGGAWGPRDGGSFGAVLHHGGEHVVKFVQQHARRRISHRQVAWVRGRCRRSNTSHKWVLQQLWGFWSDVRFTTEAAVNKIKCCC